MQYDQPRSPWKNVAAMAAVCLALCAVFAPAPRCVADVADIPGEVLTTAQEKRVDEILSTMTLEEKLGQLTQQWGGKHQDINPGVVETAEEDLKGQISAGMLGSLLGADGAAYTNRLQKAAVENSRLGIPLILGNDVIHGYKTIFPIPLAEAATFAPEQMEKSARVAAVEAYAAGTHWTFAPMVDICRDPRWGRVAEGAGEDPYLGKVAAAARVRGFQGASLADDNTIVACAKHYVAYGAPEGGRDYNTVDISLRTLREIHLPPFEAAVKAGVGTLMSSFNEINGVPGSGCKYTLDTVLRQEWGFDGFVVSDWSSVTEMVPHGYAADNADAAVKGLLAGVDMDMSSFSYRTHLDEALKAGRVSQADINKAVRRVLRMKMLLGLFDDPYRDPAFEGKVTLCPEHREAARDVARHSVVLLKNEGDILPLDPEVRSIALIGPLADSQLDMLGTWHGYGKPEDVVTVLAGVANRVGSGVTLRHEKGCEVNSDDRSGFDKAVAAAKESDVVVLVLGESEDMSGEAHSRSSLDLPGVQQDLAKAVMETGKPTVLLLANGRPMSIDWCAEHVPAILVTWHLGVEAGNAIADVLFGDFNPGGKLPITFPRTVGQVPIYYAFKNTGRPPTDQRYTSKYIDVPWTPLYPFGYGLSYTTFAYKNLKVGPKEIGRHGAVKVEVDVTNTGKRAGDEVVQCYFRDPVACVTRPVRQLAGFERVTLKPGETKTVTFHIGRENLGFHDQDMNFIVEPGDFEVYVGGNSQAELKETFKVVDKEIEPSK